MTQNEISLYILKIMRNYLKLLCWKFKKNSAKGPLKLVIVFLLFTSHVVFEQLVESNVLCLVNEELKATVWWKQVKF